MRVGTCKNPLIAFLSIEMRYTGRNGSKNSGLPEFCFFKNFGNHNRDIQKANFFPLLPIEIRYTGRKDSKNNGLRKFHCSKNMGTQSKDMRNANILRFSQWR